MNTKFLLSMAAGLAMVTTASHAEKWDMALAYSATNFHSEMAAEFAKEVAEKTDGALEITTHPSGALFGGAEIFGAVRKGLVPMGERLISALGNENPIYEIDALPFLATSYDDAMKLYKASKPALEEALTASRVKLLYSCPWPPQGFYSIKEANTPDDVKGLKFRAYNATTSKIAETLGMAPTKIEAAELSQAFATGVAESMISSGATGYDRKLWEHVKYYYDVKAWLPRNMVIVNTKAWEGLDDSVKSVVEAAAANAETKCWAKSAELDGWYVEQFKEQGMNVAPASPALMEAFAKAGDELKATWLERAGDKGAEVLKAYEGM